MNKMIIYILISFSSVFAALDSVIIQPGPGQAMNTQITSCVQTLSSSSWENSNFGKKECISIGQYDLNTINRILISFNLPSNIQPDSIVGAYLVLCPVKWYLQPRNIPLKMSAHQLLKSWKAGNGGTSCDAPGPENSATIDGATGLERFWGSQNGTEDWQTRNVGTNDIDAALISAGSSSITYPDLNPCTFELTALVKKWLTGRANNYGILIKADEDQDEINTRISTPTFWSGESVTEPQKRPVLKIIFNSEKELPRTASDSAIIQPGPGQTMNTQITYCVQTQSSSTWENNNLGKRECISVGQYDLNTINRMLIHFNLPSNIQPDSIVGAYLSMTPAKWYPQPRNVPLKMSAYQVLKSWKAGNGGTTCESDGMTNSANVDGATGLERFWGNHDGTEDWQTPNVGTNDIDAASTPAGSSSVTYPSSDPFTFELTGLIKKWLTGSNNFGILIKADEDQDEINTRISTPAVWSGEYTTEPLKRPVLKIFYNSLHATPVQKRVAYWPFDTISNDSTIIDKEGRCNINCSNVTISPSPSFGGALECTSDSFKLEVKNSKDSLGSPNFTVECLVYFNQASPAEWPYSQQKIYSFENLNTSGLKEGYSLTIWRDGRLGLNIAKPNSTWADCISQDTLYPKNWYYVVGSYDGTNMKVYVNGKLSNTVNSPGGYVYPKINASVASQTMDGIIGYRLNGKLDELSIYNYALNSDIILKNYTLLKPKEKTPFKINFGMKTAYAKAGDTVCMPIILTNFETFSINSCQLNMHYDTASVSLIKISKEDCLIKDWALFDWNYRNGKKDSVIVAMGGAKLPLQYGDGELVKCYFVVKPGASKGDSCIISLSNIDIDENQNIVNPSCQNGKILINKPSILYGDLTGNGEVTALDAVKVLNYAVGILQLPDSAVPNFTQPVADVSGNTIITCYDAALIFQYSLGLIPTFPVQTKVLKKKTTTNTGKSAFISIISHNNGLAGAQYDIVGSNLKGCISVDMELACDSNYHFTDGIINSPIKSATTIMNLTNKKTILVGMSMPDNIDEDSILTFVRLTLLPTENQQLPQLRIVSISLNEGNIPVQIQNLPVLSTAYKNQYPMKPSMSFNNKTITISNIHSGGEFQLWSLNGKLVYKNSYTVNNNHSTFIKLNALRKGIYLYRLNSGTFTDKGSFIFNK